MGGFMIKSIRHIQSISPFAHIGGKRCGTVELLRRELHIAVRAKEHPRGARFTVSLANRGSGRVLVDRVGIAIRFRKSHAAQDWRVFQDGGQVWCGVKRLDALKPDPHMAPVYEQRMGGAVVKNLPFHRSSLQSVVWDAKRREAVLVGFLAQHRGHNHIDVVPNRHANEISSIEAWQEFKLELAPGKIQQLDPAVIARSKDPYELLEEYGVSVRNFHGRKLEAPPIVGMMTWYGYRTAINENIIVSNARLVGELFNGYPQPMQKLMLLDHGWQEDANFGLFKPDHQRFRHGMKWLTNQMARRGLKLGLWYTPACITENAPNHGELRPLQALDSSGKPLHSSVGVFGALPGHPSDPWPITFFDGGLDAVQKKWQSELKEMRRWGVVYVKCDFFALQTSEPRRSTLGIGELHSRTWKNWRKAVGPHLHLAPGSCDTNLQLGYSDSIRIATDIGNAGRWPGAMETFRYGMASIAAQWYKNRKFWVNDADSIQIAKGSSLSEARVRATTVALSGGHFMLSEDLRTVDAERIEMIRRVLPPYPEAARPLDLFENVFPEGYPHLWSLRVKTGFGTIKVLAVFNLTRNSRTFRITPEMLGIQNRRTYIALEWWQCKWLGRFRGAFQVDVPAEDVAVIHAQAVQKVPSIISVSHHITGGYIVEKVRFNRTSGTLEGILATKSGLRIVLFGHIPLGWRLAREEQFHAVVNSLRGWQAEIRTTSQRTAFAIRFEKSPEPEPRLF